MFDTVRIVSPSENQTIYLEDKEQVQKSTCYDMWKRGSKCTNCVSSKAFAQKDTFIKIDYKEGKVFLIAATPINIQGQEYVVELLKDITETGFITTSYNGKVREMNEVIEELNENSIKDELTGCYNRRYINENLPQELKEITHPDKALGVLMLDIDYFKNINDTYGHLVGDSVLKQSIHKIQTKLEENKGWIARFGGEEFIILLKDLPAEKIVEKAEKIRQYWEQEMILFEGKELQTTVSIGTCIIKSKGFSAEEVLRIADKQLYLAKTKGKNRVEKTAIKQE